MNAMNKVQPHFPQPSRSVASLRRKTGGAAATRLWLVVVLCGLAAGGCGRSGPVVEFVEGVVLLDGAPLADCVVGFSPLDPGGLSAYGQTDATGTYRLTTARGGRMEGGAAVGRYAVSLTKQRPRERKRGEMQASGPDDIEFLVPKGYTQSATSGITATVRKGRNVGPEFRYELKSDYKPAGKKS